MRSITIAVGMVLSLGFAVLLVSRLPEVVSIVETGKLVELLLLVVLLLLLLLLSMMMSVEDEVELV